jgi:hypothetical protein
MALDNELGDSRLIHRRSYDVEVYREHQNLMRLRGSVIDEKPPGLHFPADTRALTIHHMTVDLLVAVDTMTITDVTVVFESHPHDQCPRIIDHYRSLIGLSITRGFTHQIRDLFGGPRGCTHTTALLQAMAPVVVQSAWSMQVLDDREGPVELIRRRPSNEERRRRWVGNIGSCHLWAADGEHVAQLEAGGDLAPPQSFLNRAAELGLAPDEWRHQFDR